MDVAVLRRPPCFQWMSRCFPSVEESEHTGQSNLQRMDDPEEEMNSGMKRDAEGEAGGLRTQVDTQETVERPSEHEGEKQGGK
ncbi:hypothetical protein EYF80_033280 [Liparis tanakae]|uniref:Uncharacterized protein n=1 Tax=Liparis tanakae TaxID=230148 RepID=A0A4Z2GUQ1_9TELE|nr:hypothetical protein EYF80_033280 [Liparis tanakae]